jgi:Ca2+-binding RTX toxin-like protein
MVQLYRRDGGETRVNTITEDRQYNDSIVVLASGGFVAVWTDASQAGGDTSETAVMAQIFDAAGDPAGDQFLVNSRTGGFQGDAAAAALPGGGFVMAWTDTSGDAYGDIRAQAFDAAGAEVGGQILVNSNAGNTQEAPAITVLSSGGYVVTWTHHSGNEWSWETHIRAQTFDAAGRRVGGEFNISSQGEGRQHESEVTALASGGFVASWSDEGGIKAQVYDAAGARIGSEVAVSVEEAQGEPQITALASGGFVVIWNGFSFGGGYTNVDSCLGQVFDANGVKVGPELYIGNPSQVGSIDIAALTTGGFVAVWAEEDYETDTDNDIRAQVFDDGGARIGTEFLVNSARAGSQVQATVSGLPSGGFVVSWTSFNEARESEVKSQMFEPTAAAPTDIALSNARLSETAMGNTTVAELSARGAVNSDMTFTLGSDSTGGAFRLDGDKLVLADNRLLDFETAPSARLVVEVTDSNGNSYRETILLRISDVTGETRYSWGDEFAVGGTAPTEQLDVHAAGLAGGGFVMSWSDQGADDSRGGVKAQLFDASGAEIGDAFLVNTATAGAQYESSVSALSGGGFVVAWTDAGRTGSDASGTAVKARILDAGGNPVGGEFRVNSAAGGDQAGASVAGLASGGFVVTWSDRSGTGGDTSDGAIKGQLFNEAGTRLGDEFLVNSATDGAQYSAEVIALESGGFIVTWVGPDGVSAQIFNRSGAKVGGEIAVSDNPNDYESTYDPEVIELASGGFVISWTRGYGYDSGSRVEAQIFDSLGAKAGDAFVVHAPGEVNQSGASIAALHWGGFIVTWHAGDGWDSRGYEIRGQMYDAAGHKVGSEFLAGEGSSLDQYSPTIALLEDGGLALGWTERDMRTSDIRARTLSFEEWQHEGTAGADLLVGSDLGEMILGKGGNDQLTGRGGNDLLDGGAGADRMAGGAGDDLYVVDSSNDRVSEAARGGRDTVLSSASFSLGIGLETLELTGAADINGTGNALSNSLVGNAGSNRLNGGGGNDKIDGGAGADRMSGGAGNDSYRADDAGDRAIEAASEGVDTVTASVSHTLLANVENLTLTGSDAIDGRGNALANVLIGNSGANSLDGRAGADLMKGGLGDDVYAIDHAGDRAVERAGGGTDLVRSATGFTLGSNLEHLTLTGSRAVDGTGNGLANSLTGNGGANSLDGAAGADALRGGGGDDRLYGGAGNDALTGGIGADRFAFDTALDGARNVDILSDFAASDDTIMLGRGIFTGIGGDGRLGAGAFHAGASAADAGDRILYDAATGKIFYDGDGAGGAAAILFARVDPGTALSHADFIGF